LPSPSYQPDLKGTLYVSDLMSDLMANSGTPFVAQYMEIRDIPEVMAIEKDSFPLPWSAAAYRHELTQNDLSCYIVVRKRGPPRVSPRTRRFDGWFRKPKPRWPPMVGYGGFWVLGEEAHISTIAVRPDWRGHGIGELLLIAMIDSAAAQEAQFVTLEVRISNLVAQNLYLKYLFEKVGRRRRYYRDNDEDALIMTTPHIDDPTFLETYCRRRQALYERLRSLAMSGEQGTIKQKR
jgi:ribosomal-protein-alanine N-acetyltransferase